MSNRLFQNITSITILGAVGVFAVAAVVAQIMAPEFYDINRHAISALAAQGYDNAWIMRLGLIGYGALLALGILLHRRTARSHLLPDSLLLLYAVGVVLVGFFPTYPMAQGVPFSQRVSWLHSFFASAAILFISLAILSSAVIEKR